MRGYRFARGFRSEPSWPGDPELQQRILEAQLNAQTARIKLLADDQPRALQILDLSGNRITEWVTSVGQASEALRGMPTYLHGRSYRIVGLVVEEAESDGGVSIVESARRKGYLDD